MSVCERETKREAQGWNVEVQSITKKLGKLGRWFLNNTEHLMSINHMVYLVQRTKWQRQIGSINSSVTHYHKGDSASVCCDW